MATRLVQSGAVILSLVVLLPVIVLAQPKPRTSSLLPKPRVSLVQALGIARKDARDHGPLTGSGGYLSRIEYGHFRKLSSGARCTCASPNALVWAITYTDVRARTQSRQIISATTGKVLTRVYYPPPMP